MVIPYVGTETWINSLNLTIESGWQPWFVEGQVAGYWMRYTHKTCHLTFATVKGGGHTAPEYKPKECLAMIDRWFAYYPL
ncbi:putative Serine carboxypeptidase [Melia azedarach]|uniref:Serine carboxypeptidase n=1 Tax=Melia azedarach TaxID=155640 RepID=A0ACC1XYU7_MELAZ|nr:putative Serine carboxypeptidase [Melia azedarach]